jgi:cyclin-dependent kinase 2
MLTDGAYGDVYKAIDRVTQETVAIKKINLDTREEGVAASTIREISALRDLSTHPNIVQLKGMIQSNDEQSRIYLIFEYVERDLKKLLAGPRLDAMVVKVFTSVHLSL